MEDNINDCYVDILGKQPTAEQLQDIAKGLPEDIHLLAQRWGWNDTVVGDKIYVWISDNYKTTGKGDI